jgi:hypothetical protein
MGLTVGCARCHDHKYDPIPTKDYYSLYGVFASCNEPDEKPLLGGASLPSAYGEYVAERKKRETELNDFRTTKEAEAVSQVRQKSGDYLLAAYDTKQLSDGTKAEGLARERKLDPATVQKWKRKLEGITNSTDSVFGVWVGLAALPENDFDSKARELCASLANDEKSSGINRPVRRAFVEEPPSDLKEAAALYGRLFAEVDKEWQELVSSRKHEGGANSSPPERLPDTDREALRQVLYSAESPAHLSGREIQRLFDVPTAQKVRALRRKLEELDATHAGAPPRGMVLRDNSSPTEPHVFVRGNPGNPGAAVPRQFLEVIAGENRKPFQKGSGRMELAEAIVSRDNPLTARVIVNRVWLQYFGAGLVRTPSDFGLRSDPPTHPELLDYLASYLIDHGWSLKQLHRLILLSNAYQQNSDGDSRNLQVDPDNRLLWKMNRKRLDFESMRDSLLAVAGRLDLTEGGHGVDITATPFSTRRAIFGFVERQNLPGLFRTFDFASPDTSSSQRFSTTVPQQALFLLNSPFIIEQARSMTSRVKSLPGRSTEDSIRALYAAAFQRPPAVDELEIGSRFIQAQSRRPSAIPDPPAWQYGYGVFNETNSTVLSFTPLPHFADKAWQGGPALPDPNLGWVMLNASGGHPGAKFATIRRWIAPLDGKVSITGTLKHESDKGDGVRGRIVTSHQGLVREWVAQHSQQQTSADAIQVRRGDTIDFVTDCRGDENSDSFSWAPTVRFTSEQTGARPTGDREWSARDDFSGPKELPKPLEPLERYAQVLLVSDELFFID